jgi:lipopolysaccharide export system protein LptA
MDKVTAQGNVVITTAREKVYGDKGTYNVPAQKAVLTGKVRIYQGKNWLEGTRAEVDMKTGISQLFAETRAEGGRVKGVFYPKAEKPAAP